MTKWIFLGASLLLMMAGCASTPQVATPSPTAPLSTRTPAPTPKPSQVATPTPAPVPHITAEGRLSFVNDRKLAFGISGKVGQVNVNEADRVIKGQVLTRLDTTPLEQAVNTAELALKSAENDLTQAQNGVKSAETDLKQVQNNVTSAGIDLQQAQDNFRKIAYPYSYYTVVFDVPEALANISDARREITAAAAGLQIGLPAEKYVAISGQLRQALDSLNKSRELLDRGQGDDVFQSQYLTIDKFWTLRAAQLQVDKSTLAVETAKNAAAKMALTADNTKAVLNKGQLAVDKAKNDLAKARDDLAKATIAAPFDGVIATVSVNEGDFLPSANYVAIEIIDPSRIELDVKVSELDIASVKAGQKVNITLDALPEARFSSVVTSVSPLPLVESGVVSYLVAVVFEVPKDSPLKAGMRATADIISDNR